MSKGHEKVEAAVNGCERAQDAWSEANTALSGCVSFNGYGVYLDRGEPLRRKLRSAQKQIAKALTELDAIDWPTEADYDQLEL